jgi:GntR family transcriptional regulator, N-acetylglucosamine utilization regulator
MEVLAINKALYTPYYIQLRDILSREIDQQRWKVGEQIPSELELCDTFNVSRTVVRQALQDLVMAGKLVREKGRGTFVAKPKVRETLMQNLVGLYETTQARGQSLETRVLRLVRIAPSDVVREQLGLGPDEDVIVLRRLRSVDGAPLSLDLTYLPYRLVPQLLEEDLARNSLYSLIEDKYGFRIAKGRRTIEAMRAEGDVAQLLQIEAGDAVLLLTSVSYLDSGQAIEYFESIHPGNRSRFEVDVMRERTF